MTFATTGLTAWPQTASPAAGAAPVGIGIGFAGVIGEMLATLAQGASMSTSASASDTVAPMAPAVDSMPAAPAALPLSAFIPVHPKAVTIAQPLLPAAPGQPVQTPHLPTAAAALTAPKTSIEAPAAGAPQREAMATDVRPSADSGMLPNVLAAQVVAATDRTPSPDAPRPNLVVPMRAAPEISEMPEPATMREHVTPDRPAAPAGASRAMLARPAPDAPPEAADVAGSGPVPRYAFFAPQDSALPTHVAPPTWAVLSDPKPDMPVLSAAIPTPTQAGMPISPQSALQTPLQPELQTPAQIIIRTSTQTAIAMPAIPVPTQAEMPTSPQAVMQAPAQPKVQTAAQAIIWTPTPTAIAMRAIPVPTQAEMPTSPQVVMQAPAQPEVQTPAQAVIGISAQTAIAMPAIPVPTQAETPTSPQAVMQAPAQFEAQTLVQTVIGTPAQTAIAMAAQAAIPILPAAIQTPAQAATPMPAQGSARRLLAYVTERTARARAPALHDDAPPPVAIPSGPAEMGAPPPAIFLSVAMPDATKSRNPLADVAPDQDNASKASVTGMAAARSPATREVVANDVGRSTAAVDAPPFVPTPPAPDVAADGRPMAPAFTLADPVQTLTRPAQAAAPIAQPPVPVIPAQPGRIGHDLGVEIARRVSAGGDELVVRLDPAELGRIEVRMSFDDRGGLKTVIAADSAVALDMLRRDSADLGRSLSDAGFHGAGQGLRFDSGSGDRSQGQPRSPWHSANQKPGHTDDFGAAPDFDQTAYRSLRTSGRYDLIA